MKRRSLLYMIPIAFVTVIVMAGDRNKIEDLERQTVVDRLMLEHYPDSVIKQIMDLPRMSQPIALVLPDTILRLDELLATNIIDRYGTQLGIFENGRRAVICSLNKTIDSSGIWHICMDVWPLYPREDKR